MDLLGWESLREAARDEAMGSRKLFLQDCVIIFGLELHQARNELLGLRGRKTRS